MNTVSLGEHPFWHCAAPKFSLAICPLSSNPALSDQCINQYYCSFKTRLFFVVLLCISLSSTVGRAFPLFLDHGWSVGTCPTRIDRKYPIGACASSAADPHSAPHCCHFSSVRHTNPDPPQHGQTAKSYALYWHHTVAFVVGLCKVC